MAKSTRKGNAFYKVEHITEKRLHQHTGWLIKPKWQRELEQAERIERQTERQTMREARRNAIQMPSWTRAMLRDRKILGRYNKLHQALVFILFLIITAIVAYGAFAQNLDTPMFDILEQFRHVPEE